MSELREVIGEVIYTALYGPQGGVWRAVETREVWYCIADAALRALSEAGRTYEQGVADGRAEDRFKYEKGDKRIAELEAQLAQAREALKGLYDSCNGAGENADGIVLIRAPQASAMVDARTTLAALTAGSTEGGHD